MTTTPEAVILQHLTDVESLDVIAREGIDLGIFPDEQVAKAVAWSLKYFLDSGKTQAPTPYSLVHEFGQDFWIEDLQVDPGDDPDESVEWALSALKSDWIRSQAQQGIASLAQSVAIGVGPSQRVEAFAGEVAKLNRLVATLDRQTQRMGVEEGVSDALVRYQHRASLPGSVHGLSLGMVEIDAHTYGINDTELAILAAGPKTGKSFALAWSAIADARRGRRVLLVTMENSVAMTWDRILCMVARVDTMVWQTGKAQQHEIERVVQAQEEIRSWPGAIEVVQPELGQRTVETLVSRAIAFGADSLVIDQLTFLELPDPRKAKTERIGMALHTLKALISSGRRPLSCLMAHQINREGVKMADRVGHLEMFHLADSAEIERTADWVFGLYASHDDKIAGMAKLQILASRRAPTEQWSLTWHPYVGNVRVRSTFALAT